MSETFIAISRWGITNDTYIVARKYRRRLLLAFSVALISFIALDFISSISRLKFRVSSKYIPKCFWKLAKKFSSSLKKIFGWNNLFNILLRIEWHFLENSEVLSAKRLTVTLYQQKYHQCKLVKKVDQGWSSDVVH